MKFKLPILSEEFDINNNEVVKQENYIDCELNFSLDAQETWENTFPEMAKNMGLFDFVENYKDLAIKDQASAGIALKIIYCFMLFDKEMSFREFVRLFTFSDLEYFEKLCNVLKNVISYITDKNKNKKKY